MKRTKPETPLISYCCLIEEKHKQMLEEIRFIHKKNFSEVVRRGIEIVHTELIAQKEQQ